MRLGDSLRLEARMVAATIVVAAGALTSSTWADALSDSTVLALRDAAQQLMDKKVGVPPRLSSIVSSAESGVIRAEGQAVIERPFQDAEKALGGVGKWCVVMMLHINNKQCRIVTVATQPHIVLRVARKYDHPIEQGYDFDFTYHEMESSARLLSVRLDAPEGPLGTSNYSMRLDATPLDDRRTVLRLSYVFRRGVASGVAMDLYLATVGRGKVGFTVTGLTRDGQSEFVGGLRGMVERNLMLYLLAIEATISEPESGDSGAFTRRLRQWFRATEEYPRQLHEIDQATYLDLKTRI